MAVTALDLAPIFAGLPYPSQVLTFSGNLAGCAALPSGARLVGQFRALPTDQAPLITASTDDGSIVVIGAQSFELNLTAAQTAGLPLGLVSVDFLRFDLPVTPIRLPFRLDIPVLEPITRGVS